MSAQWLKLGIEPSLEDLLDDPITQLLMRRDGLDRDQICRLLRTVRSARAAAAALAPAAR